MSLNKFLCKYFDSTNKGYVTIGNFLTETFSIGLTSLIIIGSLYSVYVFFAEGSFWVDPNFVNRPLLYIVGFVITFVSLFVMIIAALCILYEVTIDMLNFKIAKCEKK
jgi:magnesium-transporting ATPase (P-type)